MLLYELPADILIALFCFCDLKDLLRIEQTCRRLRDLASTQQIWLFYLRRLDQAHAPSLPYHTDAHSLKSEELRTMVTRAVQAYENWRNGAFGKNAQSRDIYIDLNDPPAAHLAHPGRKRAPTIAISVSGYAPRVTLFPGGDYLLVQWTHGFVQLVDIGPRNAIWTYPDHPSAQTNLSHGTYSDCLCYDVAFQADGYANIVVAYWKAGTENVYLGTKELIIEAFRFSLASKEISILYSRTESAYYPGYISIAIEGDFVSLHCHGSTSSPENFSLLIIIDFVKDQNVLAKIPLTDEYLKSPNSQEIKIVLGHLFLTCIRRSNPPLLRVLDVRHALTIAGTGRRMSFTDSEAINVNELELSDIFFELPIGHKSLWMEVALPSLCSFHWKEGRKRHDQLTVEIPAKELQSQCCGWFINRYILTPRTSYGEPPMLSLVSSSKVFPSPSTSYDMQRLKRYHSRSLSGCSIMRYSAYDRGENQYISSFVLTTIDDSNTDANHSSQGQTPSSIRTTPKWLTNPRKLDYLSGAIITCEDQRRIKIAYPA